MLWNVKLRHNFVTMRFAVQRDRRPNLVVRTFRGTRATCRGVWCRLYTCPRRDDDQRGVFAEAVELRRGRNGAVHTLLVLCSRKSEYDGGLGLIVVGTLFIG